ncbi:hypothetical protein B0H66DRAFT_87851 [Apodospora peruviana]|uniref:RRM domain-containing protein n=1 Tax=Apodospora peruviana TaxID=516989 RepID=A0AAE0ITM8_9PEZI|nr:hypothetical protein B0H66DRAFT_87851 [Apodospora peruviana]
MPATAFNLRLTRSASALKVSDRAPFTPIKFGLGPSRSVTFKDVEDDDEMESPTKAFVRRRIAHRAATNGFHVLQGTPTPSSRSLHSKLSNLSSDLHQTGDVDAQGIYPPSACVFVANLPEPKDDRALEAAITREFSQYGTVFVKIRRDHNNMPFAFCQYTVTEDAVAAMENGRGAIILGRPCRTEMVKANRSFIFWKRSGTYTTVDEARHVLEPYGDLSKCEPLHQSVQESMNLPPTILVEFAKFDPARDLTPVMRSNLDYQVVPFDIKKRAMASTRANDDEEFLKQYDINRRSVYVTGLPFDATESEIGHHFSMVGEILNISLNKRVGYNGEGRMFAFVEFSRADRPDVAIHELNNSILRGYRIHVQRKVVKNNKTPKRVKSMYQLKSTPSFESTGSVTAAESGVAGKLGTPAQNSRSASVAQQVSTTPVTPVTPVASVKSAARVASVIPTGSVAPGVPLAHHIGTPIPIHHHIGASMPLQHPIGATLPVQHQPGTPMPAHHQIGANMPMHHQPGASVSIHHGMMYQGAGPAYPPSNYVTLPMHGNNGMFGTYGLPPSPGAAYPNGVNPYLFGGGYWPNHYGLQRDASGLVPYVVHNSPSGPGGAPSTTLESPTRLATSNPSNDQ